MLSFVLHKHNVNIKESGNFLVQMESSHNLLLMHYQEQVTQSLDFMLNSWRMMLDILKVHVLQHLAGECFYKQLIMALSGLDFSYQIFFSSYVAMANNQAKQSSECLRPSKGQSRAHICLRCPGSEGQTSPYLLSLYCQVQLSIHQHQLKDF